MAEPRHLNKAPIAEAVVDIQCVATVDVNRLQELGSLLNFESKGDPVHFADIHLNPNPGATTSSTTHAGFKFSSSDKKYIGQFRTNGMTFSRLPPYDTWETLFSMAQRGWESYTKIASVQKVTRIAVRNINRLSFPRAQFAAAPGRFLTAAPSLPAELDPFVTVGQFISRYHIQEHSTGMNAFLTQISDPNITKDNFSLVIDVDAYCARPLSAQISELVPLLEQLHLLKNKLFFSSVTEETLQPFI